MDVFAQSLLDTQRLSDLQDLVDGMDLSTEWGEENLALDEVPPFHWAAQLNQEIEQLIPDPGESMWYTYNIASHRRKENWVSVTSTKRKRIGAEVQEELYATRFRPFNYEEKFKKYREQF